MNKKQANGKAKKAKKSQQEENRPQWKPLLNMYRDLQRLVFESNDDLERAVDLLWTDDLRDLPHDSPDGKSIAVPAEAVEFFARAGLKFSAKKLLSISDLTPEQIKSLRR